MLQVEMEEMVDSSKKLPKFSDPEKDLLLDVVAEHIRIIESKKGDASQKQRTFAWSAITENFNSRTLTGPRTSMQLRKTLDNFKRTARKHRGDDKVFEPMVSNLTEFDKRLLALLDSVNSEPEIDLGNNIKVRILQSDGKPKPLKRKSTLQEMHGSSKTAHIPVQAHSIRFENEVLKMKRERHKLKMEILNIAKEKETYERELRRIELQEKQSQTSYVIIDRK